jgi:hypothetical protein
MQIVAKDLQSPKLFSLQQIVLHGIAQKCWGDFVLRKISYGERIFIPRETETLIAYQKAVLNKLPQTFSTNLPKQLRDKLVNAVTCLQQGYSEALIWEEKCQSALPLTTLNPLTAGQYKAGNFIDPTGHFDDLLWAKYFVTDEKQFVQYRFELACFYGFEETITVLWQTMKTNQQLPCEGKLADIRSEFGDLVGLWAYQLEKKIDELIEEDSDYADGFYVCGFTEAIYRGHEYAARFFWAHCSDAEKDNFLREPKFQLLSNAAENNHVGLVNFIYSLLPLEQKNNLILWTVQHNMGTGWIWSCLLHSPFYESVLKDILTFPFPIPSRIYESILSLLAYKIKELEIPVHKTIFKALWKHLPQEQQKEVLKMDYYIISTLTAIKAIDLLETIIQPLAHSEKEKMLLNDWRNAGRTALNEFAKADDYDALLRYLCFFFIDCNPSTQKLSLKGDATNFLDRFIKGEFFIHWTENELSELEKKKVNKIIACLQGSLQVIDNLLDQVEQQEDKRIAKQRLKRQAETDEETNPLKKQKLARSFTFFSPVIPTTPAQTTSHADPESSTTQNMTLK